MFFLHAPHQMVQKLSVPSNLQKFTFKYFRSRKILALLFTFDDQPVNFLSSNFPGPEHYFRVVRFELASGNVSNSYEYWNPSA